MKITTTRSGRRLLAGVASTALVALAATGCAEDSVAESGSGGDVAADTGVTAAEERLGVIEEGTSVLPDPTPRPAFSNAHIALVVNGMNNESSAQGIAGSQEACKELQWTCDVLDGKSDPTTYSGLIRQAVASGVDAIVAHGIDCATVAQAVRDASAAGIPVIGQIANTCGDDDPLYAGSILYPDADDPTQLAGYQQHNEQFGRDRGAAIVANTGGEPHLIDIYNTEVSLLSDIDNGTVSVVEQLQGSTVEKVEMRLADLGPQLEALTTAALLKSPDANAISGPFGASYAAGIVSAIEKADRDDLFVMGVEGATSELDLMREGKVDAVMFADNAWGGWAGIDVVNSILTGVDVVSSGIGWTYVTADDLSDEPGTPPEVEFPDYRSAYLEAWGV